MAEEIHCVPAAPPAPPAAPGPDDSAAKTMIVDRGGKSKMTLVVGLLAFFLLAGIVTAVAVKRGFAIDAGTAATAAETAAPEEPDDAAPAAPAGSMPAECVGDIADPQLRWYCTEFLPFAQKASADHDRIDRLETERKNDAPGVPMGLWIVVIAIGVLTAFNTVKILSSGKEEKPPPGTGTL